MPFDIQKLDGDIERLNEIRRFVSDPRSAELLEQLYVQNLHGSASNGRNGKHPSGIGSANATYGTQTKLVRDVLTRISGTFIAADVGKELRSSGTNISNNQVGKVFTRLQRRDEIRVVEQGSGSAPNAYEKTRKFGRVD